MTKLADLKSQDGEYLVPGTDNVTIARALLWSQAWKLKAAKTIFLNFGTFR
jgi:hypothetical protein